MYNLIFLDIDGVLNSDIWYESIKGKVKFEKEHSHFDPKAVNMLNDLCKKTNSKVVISSTWRIGKTIEELQQLLNEVGGNFEIIGKTGRCCSGIRGVEIRNWLNDNSELPISNYVILDDDSDMLLWQQKHFFQCDRYVGLTKTVCYKVDIFLNANIMSIF